tara:strand:+ start:1545 stop:2168 length:624 start_codon:yes stop_codon:yes gene_type:complete
MKIHDISMEIFEGMTVYPGDPGPKIESKLHIPEHKVNVSMLSLGTHAGTHIDAPRHFIQDGNTIDKLKMEHFVGKCKVFDLSNKDIKIEKKDLEGLDINEGDIVLFKTKNSFDEMKEFNEKFIYFDGDCAEFFVEKGVKTVGVDYISISDTLENPIHKELLSNNIVIIESLRLKDIKDGEYFFICLPLKLKDCDGSPARAVLVEGLD